MSSRLPERPFLYPIVDVEFLAGRPVGPVVTALARGGASLLQLRAKHLPDGAFLALAREALAAARDCGVPLVVNDRTDIARIVGADGVHLGQDDLTPAEARPLLPSGALIGLSTHSLVQIEAAANEPVDYLAVGPIFATRTKMNADPAVGTELVWRARERTQRPLVAIGGITRERARDVVAAGADGVAVISGLLAASDLSAAAREWREALEGP